MDPLSLTATVVGLTATCVQTAKALSDIKDKFQNAALTISAICTETMIISASLSQIQSSMLSSPSGLSAKLSARPDLEATLDHALTGCYVVFDVLQVEVQKLTESTQADSTGVGFRTKLRYMWSEGTMQDILTQLRGLQTALTLLFQLLGTDTMAELKKMMDNNTTVLAQVVQRTAHFRVSRVSQAPQSIFDTSFTTQSIHYGDGTSTVSATLFSFDDEIVNSQAYRRALAKAYASSNDAAKAQSGSNDNGIAIVAGETSTDQQPSLDSATLHPQHTGREAAQIADEMNSVSISDDLVLGTTPRDPLSSFLVAPKELATDWSNFWAIKASDLKTVSKNEFNRQNYLHEIIQTEHTYLRSLQIVRYLYKYRMMLDFGKISGEWPFRFEPNSDDIGFPGFEDIHYANKTLLYDPFVSRQSSEGPWLSVLWDIFSTWLKQSADLYIKYASVYPHVLYAVRNQIRNNARLSRWLDESRDHPLSNRLGWETYLKSPLTRLQRYCLFLNGILKVSDSSEPRHQYHKLKQLFDDITSVTARCDVAVSEGSKRVELTDLRSRIEIAGSRVLPNDSQIELQQMMLHKDGRFSTVKEVMILVIRKPEPKIVVLRAAAKPKTINSESLDLIFECQANTVKFDFHWEEDSRSTSGRRHTVILQHTTHRGKDTNPGLLERIDLWTYAPTVWTDVVSAIRAIRGSNRSGHELTGMQPLESITE